VIDLPRIRSWVEAAGYAGFHEVEIFSELDWWQRDPDEVLRVWPSSAMSNVLKKTGTDHLFN